MSNYLEDIILFLLSLVDIQENLVPESLYKWGVFLGLLQAVAIGYFLDKQSGLINIFDHLAAPLMGFSVIETLRRLSFFLYGYEMIGLGDSKLAAIGGAWLGIQGMFVSLGLAFISGAIFSIIRVLSRKLRLKESFAFGPFVNTGIWGVWLFESTWWWKQWFNLLGLK